MCLRTLKHENFNSLTKPLRWETFYEHRRLAMDLGWFSGGRGGRIWCCDFGFLVTFERFSSHGVLVRESAVFSRFFFVCVFLVARLCGSPSCSSGYCVFLRSSFLS